MTIEVKIIACNKMDLMTQLKQLAEMATGPDVPAPTLEYFSMQEIVEFLAGQGYYILPDVTPAEPEKKTRRKKITEAAEKDPPFEPSEEEADEATNEPADDNLEELKSDVLARCSQLMLDGRRDVVLSLKKQFGRTLTDLPADRFPEIAAELERILNDGETDE